MANYSTLTDHELLARLIAGDHAAYEQIYNRYDGLLYLFAYRRLKNREAAKDCIHELFLKLQQDREELPAESVLAAYLYAALRNRIINMVAHEKVIARRYLDSFISYADQLHADDADHLVRHNDLQTFIEAEIAVLNPRT